MNSSRIEIKCSEGDVGLSCVISPGEEEGEYYIDKMMMEEGFRSDLERWESKSEEQLQSDIRQVFMEFSCMELEKLNIKVMLNGRRFIEYCWDTGLLHKQDMIEVGLKATQEGINVIKKKSSRKCDESENNSCENMINKDNYKLN